ncbi:MAG: hypothetical protein INR71_11500 [Terriglobus roseus]|nr:hypothetical protein [Terriglobus roseus]
MQVAGATSRLLGGDGGSGGGSSSEAVEPQRIRGREAADTPTALRDSAGEGNGERASERA